VRTSAKGIALIKAFEGCRLKAYRDAVGVLTIGWGHTNHHPPAFSAGARWTQQQADAVLIDDLVRFEQRVERLVKVPLAQHQFDALVSFDFNTGALHKSTLLKRLNLKDYAGAAAQFARWNKAGGMVLAGLVRRRASETLMFLGEDDADFDGKPDRKAKRK
jgi:lysozyme